MLPIIKNLELLPIKAKKIKVINSKLKKPIMNNFDYKNEINATNFKINRFLIKNINFKINNNKLNYTK